MLLTDMEELSIPKSSSDSDEPKRPMPITDIVEPILPLERRDKAEPKCRKSNTESAEPTRAIQRDSFHRPRIEIPTVPYFAKKESFPNGGSPGRREQSPCAPSTELTGRSLKVHSPRATGNFPFSQLRKLRRQSPEVRSFAPTEPNQDAKSLRPTWQTLDARNFVVTGKN